MQITLYTNRCPCCEVLEAALKAASLDFEAVTATGQMLSMGMTHLPMLSVDGTMMNYPAALAWLKERKERCEDRQV